PRKSDQTVRGAVALPRGTGKSVRVAVVAEGAAAEEAKAAGLASGAHKPGTEKAGKITRDQIREIIQIKKEDINARSEEAAMRIIEGTARSMGIEVVDA
ncbi:MAG: hypothetical protein IKC05_07950, partial [Lentisphaeria bacterium]|nr:hypothetical protein [Lentisphaeria bacterium]